MSDENPLLLIDGMMEIQEMNDFMQDKSLEEAFDLVIKLMMKPDVPPAMAQTLIVKLQSYASYFAMHATIYSTIKKDKAGSSSYHKKNIYYTAADALDKIVQALKYAVKTQY
ncbi:hypothetical protein HUN41_00089 [Streptomyces phage Coruscant]|uniref:Uncharacterized protein n=1 Tax=Streptomyces phage Coruscant TaxID=2739834 RepID=A0A7G4AW28_9CAUD|nr:hypothetical protein PP454_gp199 [Streptomyces phage Coruscant]QMP84218.1 hypothetical protein HUN41_00089 [Streptomyces phage Coruscant]